MRSAFRNKTILVTGGTGFIGSRLVSELQKEDGVTVIVWSKETLDLSDKTATKEAFQKLGRVDYVVHLAAMIPSADPQTDELQANIEQNLLPSVYLAEFLPDTVQGFVYASTIDVYGRPASLPIKEEHALRPITLYGASKAAAEHYLSVLLAKRNVPCTIVRYSQVYGPGEPQIKAIPHFIEAVIKEEEPVLYGDGSEMRDYVYVEDAAAATLLALERNTGGVFNIGSGQAISIKEVLHTIAKICGKDIHPIQKPRVKEAFDSVMDIRRAKEELGYNPLMSMREGLQKEIEFYQNMHKEGKP